MNNIMLLAELQLLSLVTFAGLFFHLCVISRASLFLSPYPDGTLRRAAHISMLILTFHLQEHL